MISPYLTSDCVQSCLPADAALLTLSARDLRVCSLKQAAWTQPTRSFKAEAALRQDVVTLRVGGGAVVFLDALEDGGKVVLPAALRVGAEVTLVVTATASATVVTETVGDIIEGSIVGEATTRLTGDHNTLKFTKSPVGSTVTLVVVRPGVWMASGVALGVKAE